MNLNVLIMAGNQKLMENIIQNQTSSNRAGTLENLKEAVPSNRLSSPDRFMSDRAQLKLNFNIAHS